MYDAARPYRRRPPSTAHARAWWWTGWLAVLFALVTPASVHGAEPAARIEGHHALGLSEGQTATFDALLLEAISKGADEAGVEAREDASAVLRVSISWADDRQIDYEGQILVVDGEQELAIRGFGCRMCGTEQLFDRVRSEVVLALGRVTWPEPEPEADAAAAISPADDTNAASDDASPRGRRPMFIAGVAVAGVGLGAMVTGAVLATRDDRIELRPEDPMGPVYAKTLRPPGIGLLIAGAGAMAIGTTLVVVDLVRHRRRAVALSPAVGPGLAGLSVQGRF